MYRYNCFAVVNNPFHGGTTVKLRVNIWEETPDSGEVVLSDGQVKRLRKVLCGRRGCECLQEHTGPGWKYDGDRTLTWTGGM